MRFRLNGLIAATYTPLHADGTLNLDAVPPMVERLIQEQITGLYVCGSTGEGMSLTGDERRQVAEAFVHSAAGRLPVVVQVGHNSLAEARQLAAHAQSIGADAISATAPSYFTIESVELLIESMVQVAEGAPDLPFYYYHIPGLTGADLNMIEFLERGGERIRNLVGLKYTTTEVHVYQSCLRLHDKRWDALWGCDEMLLSALAVGCTGAIGSTYNIVPRVYRRLIDAFNAGQLAVAREHQAWAAHLIDTVKRYPFHPAMKCILGLLGLECGPCRLPQPRLSASQVEALRRDLEATDFSQHATG
jgi:N-acetylneuraminate lyase